MAENYWGQKSEELFLIRDIFLSHRDVVQQARVKISTEDLIAGYVKGLNQRKELWEFPDLPRLKRLADWVLKNPPETKFISSRWQVVYQKERPAKLISHIPHNVIFPI